MEVHLKLEHCVRTDCPLPGEDELRTAAGTGDFTVFNPDFRFLTMHGSGDVQTTYYEDKRCGGFWAYEWRMDERGEGVYTDDYFYEVSSHWGDPLPEELQEVGE